MGLAKGARRAEMLEGNWGEVALILEHIPSFPGPQHIFPA